MDSHDAEERGKGVHSLNRTISGTVLLHAVLFCSAISLNLWALRRLNTCSPLVSISWDDGHQTSSLNHSQQPDLLFSPSNTHAHNQKDPLERLETRSSVKFDAELFSTSVYKGQPRKELDEAWEKIVDRMCPAQMEEMPMPNV